METRVALLLLCMGYMAVAAGFQHVAADEYPTEGDMKIVSEQRATGFHWMSPQQYRNMDKRNNTKPFLFCFTSQHCPHCRRLHEHFATKFDHTFLSSISSQFNPVLIHNSYGEEFIPHKYVDSGNYVPRTVFADADGTMRTDVQSKNASPENRYFFLARELVWQMYDILQEGRSSDFPSDLARDL